MTRWRAPCNRPVTPSCPDFLPGACSRPSPKLPRKTRSRTLEPSIKQKTLRGLGGARYSLLRRPAPPHSPSPNPLRQVGPQAPPERLAPSTAAKPPRLKVAPAAKTSTCRWGKSQRIARLRDSRKPRGSRVQQAPGLRTRCETTIARERCALRGQRLRTSDSRGLSLPPSARAASLWSRYLSIRRSITEVPPALSVPRATSSGENDLPKPSPTNVWRPGVAGARSVIQPSRTPRRRPPSRHPRTASAHSVVGPRPCPKGPAKHAADERATPPNLGRSQASPANRCGRHEAASARRPCPPAYDPTQGAFAASPLQPPWSWKRSQGIAFPPPAKSTCRYKNNRGMVLVGPCPARPENILHSARRATPEPLLECGPHHHARADAPAREACNHPAAPTEGDAPLQEQRSQICNRRRGPQNRSAGVNLRATIAQFDR